MSSRSLKQYRFIQPLSTGGSGDVYRCEELAENEGKRLVVVKLLRTSWQANEELVRSAREEWAMISALEQRNIVALYEMVSVQGRVAIVMEAVDGIDIKKIIGFMRDMKQRIPLKVSLEIVASIALTLDSLYNEAPEPGAAPLRILHRDITPENILLDGRGLVRILNLGVQSFKAEYRDSSTRELQFGSQEYMAPEQLFFEPETPASDVYSLTSTLFEMIAGKPFGKAVARAEIHNERVERYCKKLVAPLKVGIDLKRSLNSLLTNGLQHDSRQRVPAIEFSKNLRALAHSIKGPDVVAWADRAIPHFQKCNDLNRLIGGLQGSTVTEDDGNARAIFDENTIREEVDTGALRRGALAEIRTLPEAEIQLSFDLTGETPFEDDDEPFENTIEQTVQSDVSPFDSIQLFDEEYEELSEDVTKTGLETTGNIFGEQSLEPSFEDHPPMMINPKPMVSPAPQLEKPSNIGTILMVASLIGVVVVLLLFGVYYVQVAQQAEPEATTISDISDEEIDSSSGILFVSHIANAKKIMVDCDGKKKSGVEKVMITDRSAEYCFVEVRDKERNKRRVELQALSQGVYHCFQASSDGCVKE